LRSQDLDVEKPFSEDIEGHSHFGESVWTLVRFQVPLPACWLRRSPRPAGSFVGAITSQQHKLTGRRFKLLQEMFLRSRWAHFLPVWHFAVPKLFSSPCCLRDGALCRSGFRTLSTASERAGGCLARLLREAD